MLRLQMFPHRIRNILPRHLTNLISIPQPPKQKPSSPPTSTLIILPSLSSIPINLIKNHKSPIRISIAARVIQYHECGIRMNESREPDKVREELELSFIDP